MGETRFGGWGLVGANLHDALMLHSNFSGANLTGANLSRTFMPQSDFSNSNLTDASLGQASASDSNFSFANLTRATFGGGGFWFNDNFTGAKLIGVDLRNTDWFDWTVSNADFSGALLPNYPVPVRGSSPAVLPSGWSYDGYAIVPNY